MNNLILPNSEEFMTWTKKLPTSARTKVMKIHKTGSWHDYAEIHETWKCFFLQHFLKATDC